MKEHEEILDLTSKLDSDWKDLVPIVNQMERTETPEKPEMDDYDRLVKEMIFAPRGEPTEKLKTEEDLAQIEKLLLEKLEKERLHRMKGEEELADEAKQNYRSADDLDDGYFLQPMMDEEDDQVLSYPIEEGENQDEDGGSEDEENENDNEENNLIENQDEIEEEIEASENEEIDDESENNESDEDEESEDDFEDLKAESSSSEDEIINHKETSANKSNELKNAANIDESLPFTIQLPESYEKFTELFDNRSIKTQSTIIDRIIKTNHPKLQHYNKQKMYKLFAYLLQYINDLFSNCDEGNVSKYFKLLNHLGSHLFDLVQMNPEECSKSFLEVMKEKYEDYRKAPKFYPKLDTLIFFRIIGILFPTSDFRHPVVTPCYIFLHHILSQAKIKSRSDVAGGLFLSTLVLDYQQMSKRFLPAVLNFLSGICYLGIKKTILDAMKPIPPFRRIDQLLVLSEKYKNDFQNEKLSSSDFVNASLDDDFKVRALNTATCLIIDYIKLYEDHVGVKYILDPFEKVLNRLQNEHSLPSSMQDNIKSILKDFAEIRSEKVLKFETVKKSTPMLRLLEPRFETVSTDRRSMYCQAEGNAAEKKKLQHMYKREFKAAKRELRRDNEFVSKIRQKRRDQMDTERKEKVKRIFSEASTQQQEFKALGRTKGRKGTF
jgi:nucleolar protein 14